ncbi:MAG: class I SAM-dependent methyltransferase [Lachnospiraceae bacterium]|nr:class I SAM-dependent methyltransferase [Lachnospiraceae bacterium]
MSTSYKNFAYVYDTFMDNIPYDDWSKYIAYLFEKYHIDSGNLVELGCGTATLALQLVNYGYSIIGIDNSDDMLNIAAKKTANTPDIALQLQDMRDLLLDSTYDGFYCVCDSLNYLLSREDILDTFHCIKKYLRKDGIFIFDMKTIHFYQNCLGDQIFCDHQEACSYVWENAFFEDDCINQYDLTLFVRQDDSNLYEKFNEVHHQRGYNLEEIIDLLSLAGLEYVTSYDAFTEEPPKDDSERIYIIARNGEL